MKTESRFKSRLRIFVIVSLFLHGVFAVSTIVPYLVKQHLAAKRAATEQLARQTARLKAEREARETARRLARQQIEDALERDARDLMLESMEDQQFADAWEDILAGLEVDIDALLDQLAAVDFDMDLSALGDLMAQLRQADKQN